MQCPRCHNSVEDGAAFCGNCGLQMAPLYAQGATAAGDGTVIIPDRALPNNPNTYPQNYKTVATPQAYYTPTVSATPEQRNATPAPSFAPTPPPPRERHDNRRVIIMAGILVLLAVVVVTAGVLASLSRKSGTSPKTTATATTTNTGAANPSAGLVTFSDTANGGLTQSLTISATNLKSLPSGSQYYGWLLDNANEKIKALGPLKPQNGAFTLTATNGHTNFLSQGNLIEITQETGNNPTAPSGNTIILKGQFPPIAFLHIGHLLSSFDTTPRNTALLVGVRDQAEKLNTAAILLKNAANNRNTFVEQCAAQSIIDIAEGNHSQAFQQLSAACALQNVTEIGDGFGLLGNNGYIKTAKNHAGFAANGGDATQNIKSHAGHIEVIMDNVMGWTTTAAQDAQFLLTHPGDTGKIQELVQSTNRAYNGFSPNGEDQPQPISGQGGAIQGYLHGQLMATLTLTP